ncbi:MAG TPA: class I SAM-dependent methyltransferase, partial [Vicinamibacteria bacterium]
ALPVVLSPKSRSRRGRSSPDLSPPDAWSDREWFEELLRAYQPDSPPRGLLCGYPSAELQVNTIGCSGPPGLTHAYRFWVDVKQSCRALGLVLGPDTRILDFGCGWGRIARFLFKDTRPENVFGIDVDPGFIEICRRIMCGGTYQVVGALPPTDVRADSFDLIVGYSVLSHLAEPAAEAWMREFARLLRPGGVVAVTTRSRLFLDYCEYLGHKPKAPPYLEALARTFPDFQEARRRYDAGEFLFAPLHGGGVRDDSFYGEAFIPEAYARRAWSPYLEFREFRFDPDRHELALIVLQKPAAPPHPVRHES